VLCSVPVQEGKFAHLPVLKRSDLTGYLDVLKTEQRARSFQFPVPSRKSQTGLISAALALAAAAPSGGV
jgi:hypothetical protein